MRDALNEKGLDFWCVLYRHQLEMIAKYLDCFDGITFWIWKCNEIAELDKKQTPVVFLLWGANARKKAEIIKNPIHKKLITVHPSPLSAYGGFFGCGHFSKTNEILKESGQAPIDWQID